MRMTTSVRETLYFQSRSCSLIVLLHPVVCDLISSSQSYLTESRCTNDAQTITAKPDGGASFTLMSETNISVFFSF